MPPKRKSAEKAVAAEPAAKKSRAKKEPAPQKAEKVPGADVPKAKASGSGRRVVVSGSKECQAFLRHFELLKVGRALCSRAGGRAVRQCWSIAR